LAAILARQGRAVALAGPESLPGPPDIADIPRLPWDAEGSFLKPDDIWLVPEGWPNALAPGFRAGARALVYVQNWAFMLTPLPRGVSWKRLAAAAAPERPMRFLAVSGPVRRFLTDFLNLDANSVLEAVLPPAVHPVFFRKGERPGGPVRIAFMPRKNKALAEQIRLLALELTEGRGIETEFVSIHNLEREAVADILASCHIFLSTGFPEGFALPPAEAMACGCVPVGFSGLGGFEYMRNPQPPPLPGLFEPPFALDDKPWGGNGFFTADGDVPGAARALALAVSLAGAGKGLWREMTANGRRTALDYSQGAREARAAEIWKAFGSEKICGNE
jgi:glycosyltransferase involved in cell wall biosynthesis